MLDEHWFSVSSEWLLANAASLATALVVFCVGWYVAGFVSRRIEGLLRGARGIDRTIKPLLAELSRYAVIGLTLVIVLGQLGVQTASILTVVGAIGLAIALALQGTLANLAAGLMLIWQRPFNVGDYVDAQGTSGSVMSMGLFGTRLRTYDGVYIFAPNSMLWNARITNYSRETTRMVEIKVGISYRASIGKAREILVAIARDSRVLVDPAPGIFVGELDASAVQMLLRVWVKGSDWWAVKTDFTERVKLAFDEAGIEIPYNKLDITLRRMPGGAQLSEEDGPTSG